MFPGREEFIFDGANLESGAEPGGGKGGYLSERPHLTKVRQDGGNEAEIHH